MADATEGDKDSTWNKLRRRKVVQWGLAYAAGAWGLLQGLQFLAEAFAWSSRVLQFGTLIALIGLPIVLVLAWYHGDRGHQRPLRTEIAILALLFLAGGAGLWVYQRSIESTAESAAKSTTTEASAPTERKTSASVAVLPFSNLSSDPANEYLADGIAETLITMLAQVPKLMVIGKVSSFSYKGQPTDPRTIGQQLGVAALLEGSVQRAGDRLRVAVQLVSTGDGGHLWAETYDRPATDVFAVQDDIARRVTEALSVALAGKTGPGSIGTTNVAAYDAYLRGKQLVESREIKAMQEGIALLEKAVAADPNFARGWAELSGAYFAAGRHPFGASATYGYMPEEQAWALAKRAATRAVELAPEFGLAHARLAGAISHLGTERTEHYERALALSPRDPEVIRLYAGRYLLPAHRFGEAPKLLEPILAIEPRDPRLRELYGVLLDANGDVPGALRQYRAAVRLQPDSVTPYVTAALTTMQIVGAADLSLRLLRHAASLDSENDHTIGSLAWLYRRLDEKQLALKAEQELQRLGATVELRSSRIDGAIVAGLEEEARMLLRRKLDDSPLDYQAIRTMSRLRGTPDNHRTALALVVEWIAANPESDLLADARVCLNAWLGDDTAARDELANWESIWRSRHAFSLFADFARTDQLVRSLACVGRGDDALKEFEALLNEGYNIGWRDMAVDPAYDAIRGDSRFKAVIEKLKTADAAARDRFRARPDLNDADIESLGM